VLPPFSLSFFSSIEASSLSFLSKTLSWCWSFSFHGLFPSRWCLLPPLLLYLSLHFHGWKSPLKDLIEAQRSSLHRSFSSKLISVCGSPLVIQWGFMWTWLGYTGLIQNGVSRDTFAWGKSLVCFWRRTCIVIPSTRSWIHNDVMPSYRFLW